MSWVLTGLVILVGRAAVNPSQISVTLQGDGICCAAASVC